MIVAVIGLGTFGAKTATALFEANVEVMAIDKDEKLVEMIKDRVTHAVAIDVTDERSLRSVNIADVDVAVVAIGDNIEINILAVAMLRKLGVGRVIARATSNLHDHVLREIGASEIIKVEEQMGQIIANKISAPYVLQKHMITEDYSVVELKLGKKYVGKTLVECRIRQNYSLNIIALKKIIPCLSEDGRSMKRVEVNDSPMPMDTITGDDVVVLVGSEKNFKRFYEDMEES